ncbi:MAG: MBL fold metallo-hydrolase [Desulfosarcina sp.]|nr:MBL fold metallo-hydrolase [Desulfobacterales bacterium]
MVQEIAKDIFRIKVPLPETPLKYLNAYVVRSPGRSLVIDTGLNHDACLSVLLDGLKKIAVDPGRADFFITHLHSDHFGLITRLATADTRVYFNRPEAEIIENWEGFGPMLAYIGRNGFPVERLQAALQAHPGSKFGTDWVPPMQMLAEGDVIRVDDYAFECVETPGHTLGHTCLYEPAHKLFVAGDHILNGITPNIQCWADGYNRLQQYLASLAKVRPYAVDLVLPGHRRLFSGFQERIGELIAHHRERLDEVMGILEDGPLNAYEVASRMSWDIQAPDWASLPVAQQWFATGEALAHLRYLEDEGRITRILQDGVVHFNRCG